MKKTLLFLSLLFLSSVAWATPTINGTPVNAFALDTNSVTVSATVASGSNRLAIITLTVIEDDCGGVGGPGTGASVVFNTSESATRIGGSYGNCTAIEQWYLKMPSVTTANFVGSWTPAFGNSDVIGISVVVLDGANQSGAPNRTQTCQSDEVGTTQPDLNVTAVSGDLSIDGIVTWDDAITDPDAGQTERTDGSRDNSAGINMGLNISTETATDTVTEMGWTKSGINNYSQYCGVSIISVASSTSSVVPILRRRHN